MSNFTVKDAPKSRFEGEFIVEPATGQTPTPEETKYLDALKLVESRFADDEDRDLQLEKKTGAKAAVELRRRCRRDALQELRADADEFVEGELKAEIAATNTLIVRGKYIGARDRISYSLFNVVEKTSDQLAIDLLIDVAPGREQEPPAEKQSLYVALSQALTVIKAVSQRMEDRASRWFRGTNESEQARARALRDQYIRKLGGIGRLGLQDDYVQLSNLALASVKAEFVIREAGRIKNSYVRRLGVTCALFAAAWFSLFAAVANKFWLTGSFWVDHETILLAVGGACIGTWLSFSVRRVTLTFDELANLEEDLLDPGLRVIFVSLLTFTVCLLFWVGAVNIEIGNLKTAELGNPSSKLPFHEIALLVGIFSGMAERALATALSGRAAAFVRSIAGGS